MHLVKRKMIDYKVGHAPCETECAILTCYGTLALVFSKRSMAVPPSTSAGCLYSLLAYYDLFLHELLRLGQLTLMFCIYSGCMYAVGIGGSNVKVNCTASLCLDECKHSAATVTSCAAAL